MRHIRRIKNLMQFILDHCEGDILAYKASNLAHAIEKVIREAEQDCHELDPVRHYIPHNTESSMNMN